MNQQHRFPYIPPELLAALEKVYRQHNPHPGDTLEDIMYRAGQFSVIEMLRQKVEDQTRNQLTGDP